MEKKKKKPRKKKEAIKWLKLCSSTAEGMGLTVKILHALWLRRKKKSRNKKHMKSRRKEEREKGRKEREQEIRKI